MSVNPPTVPDDDDTDTPQWVRKLLGQLTTVTESINNRVAALEEREPKNDGSKTETESGNDGAEPQPQPKRRKPWIFRD